MNLLPAGLAFAILSGFSVAAPAAALSQATYLACMGAQPWWEGSWGTAARGVSNDQAKTTIKLSADKTTATVVLPSLGEQVFEIKADEESYHGGKEMSQRALDGVISSAYISINRITGSTRIGFKVTNSPADGGRWAFSGSCEPASAKF
ncbi:hypothetical protein E7V67_006285 [[Empedobacter] haloabium]|uniref:Uncharacterized protein n=1 Tax=[Empedobacter] haloabium TaxID=592317 RepID=A0ABZ1UR01_9BURK